MVSAQDRIVMIFVIIQTLMVTEIVAFLIFPCQGLITIKPVGWRLMSVIMILVKKMHHGR